MDEIMNEITLECKVKRVGTSDWNDFICNNREYYDSIPKERMSGITICNPPRFDIFKRLIEVGKDREIGSYYLQWSLIEFGIRKYEDDLKKFNLYGKFKLCKDLKDLFGLSCMYPTFLLDYCDIKERTSKTRFTIHTTFNQRAIIQKLEEDAGFSISESETALICCIYSFNAMLGTDCKFDLALYCKTYLSNIRTKLSDSNRSMDIWLRGVSRSVLEYIVQNIVYNKTTGKDIDEGFKIRLLLTSRLVNVLNKDKTLFDFMDERDVKAINEKINEFTELIEVKYPDLSGIIKTVKQSKSDKIKTFVNEDEIIRKYGKDSIEHVKYRKFKEYVRKQEQKQRESGEY